MPRMTQKYRAALELAKTILSSPLQPNDSQSLYHDLNQKNWFWNSKTGVWEQGEPAQKPTELVYVRVWADTEKVEQAASDVAGEMQRRDYRLVDRSETYPCRPPKQLESRIYLKFLFEKKENQCH